ncbi:hypothetical protein D3C77_493790 [compost metagenome]
MQLLLFVALHRSNAGVVPTVADEKAITVLKAWSSSRNFHFGLASDGRTPVKPGAKNLWFVWRGCAGISEKVALEVKTLPGQVGAE